MAVTQASDVDETRTEKGISLARGPALILGTILLAAGLYFLYKFHFFPKFSNFPNGDAHVEGKVFGLFGANGWTGMLTAVAGGLLLFGAAQHLLAKTMSLIVGVALGAAAVIALISGDVLGMAAANHWTEIAWAAAAAILLFNTLIPRRRKTVAVAPARTTGATTRRTAPTRRTAAAPAAAAPVAEREGRYAGDEGRYADEGAAAPVAERGRSADDDTRVMPEGAAAASERGPVDEQGTAPMEGEDRYPGEQGTAPLEGERRYDDAAETRVTDRDAEDDTREVPNVRRDESTREPG